MKRQQKRQWKGQRNWRIKKRLEEKKWIKSLEQKWAELKHADTKPIQQNLLTKQVGTLTFHIHQNKMIRNRVLGSPSWWSSDHMSAHRGQRSSIQQWKWTMRGSVVSKVDSVRIQWSLRVSWASCSCCWEESEVWVPVWLLIGMKVEGRRATTGGSWPAP